MAMTGRSVAMVALLAAVAISAVVFFAQPQKTTVLMQLSEDPALQEPYVPVEGELCCGTVPIPCCLSEACCEAWGDLPDPAEDSIPGEHKALPIALWDNRSPVYLWQIPVQQQPTVAFNSRNYMEHRYAGRRVW
eukprot:CAMPEP_0181328134 /NCGR_PEP_ID=MMETSP1101-20121128/22524_1 /TAXON_ID=46948 /ORGANISM="Rhodomonas abbreviata, Strain Caron Lab Isolate" /LENGTH=133 /DNA_ID=CAMNT_0023436943 /DNA_START=13 /DNA_END=414 /DNA_ORIENTATION=-